DMFLVKRSNFGSANYDGAKRTTLSDQRYGNDTANPMRASDLSPARELVPNVLYIIDANGSHFANGSPRYSGAIQWKRWRPRRLAKPGSVVQLVIFDEKNSDVLSLANVCSLFSHGLKNSCNIARRVRDQAQNLVHRRQFAGEPGGL